MADSSPITYPHVTNLTIEQAVAEVAARKESIFRDWDQLSQILERHEDRIQKRWAKKSHAQRLKVLLAAWPGMAKYHRPDLIALDFDLRERRRRTSTFRDAYVWPSINQENLLLPRTLPIMLNARGRNGPDTFAPTDASSSEVALSSRAIQVRSLDHHYMWLGGRDDYGSLRYSSPGSTTTPWFGTNQEKPSLLGFLALEIQERLLAFLLHCAETILHDLPTDQLFSDIYPVRAEPPLPAGNVEEWPRWENLIAETPYIVPKNIDYERLHALTLFTSLNAFSTGVSIEWNGLRTQLATDIGYSALPTHDKTFWSPTIDFMIVESYECLMFWTNIRDQLKMLRQLHLQYAESLKPTERLPEHYHDAVGYFRFLLLVFQVPVLSRFDRGVKTAPRLRFMWQRYGMNDTSDTLTNVKPKHGMHKDHGHFLWIQQGLCDLQARAVIGLPNLADLLQREIEDLTLVAEAHRQLYLFQPWIDMFEGGVAPQHKERAEIVAEPFIALLEAGDIVELGQPDFLRDGRFTTPMTKRASAKTTQAIRAAEAELDNFWHEADAEFARAGAPLDLLFGEYTDQRDVYRTPEWIEPVKALPPHHQTGLQGLCSDLNTLELQDRRKRTISAENIAPAQAKIKTKGVPRGEEADAEPPAVEIEATEASKSKITVSKRAFKTFAALFHNPEKETPQGEIPWNDFLHAMSSVNFGVEQLYGSVWHFTPTNLGLERSMQFHQPHPSNKIPSTTLRRWGRRLHRQYGWTLDTFVRA